MVCCARVMVFGSERRERCGDDGCWLLLGRRQSIGHVVFGRDSATMMGSCLKGGGTYGMLGALGSGR